MKKVTAMTNKGFTRQKTIDELSVTYTVRHAQVVRDNFCNRICLGKNCNKCAHCDIENAYRACVQEIKLGKRQKFKPAAEYIGSSYGAYRAFDGRGHKTEVWRATQTNKKEV